MREIDDNLMLNILLGNSGELASMIETDRKINQLAFEVAKHGTEVIEQKIEQIMKAVAIGVISDHAPGAFLEDVCSQIWKEQVALEPIMYLYDKYYDMPADGGSQEIATTIGYGFTTLMARIASQKEGLDRQILVGSAIRFLTRHNSETPDRIFEILHFGQYLFNQGAIAEGEEIVRFLNDNVPIEMKRSLEFKEAIEQVLENKS